MIRTGNDIIKNQLLKSNQFIFSTIMARKSALLEAGGFIKEHNLAEDYELRLKMGIHHKLSNLPEPLTYYRDRSDNTSNKNLLKLNLRSLKVAFSFRNDYPNPWRSLFSRLLAFFIPRKRYAWKAKRETQKNKKLAS